MSEFSCKNYSTDGGDKWVVDGVNLNAVVKAIQGDMILTVTPTTTGSSASEIATAIAGENLKYTRDVVLQFETTDGIVHDWFNGDMDIAVIETTAGDGTSAIAEGTTSVTFVNGAAAVTLEYIGTWAEADTQTLTVTSDTILGYTIANKTSVDTAIA